MDKPYIYTNTKGQNYYLHSKRVILKNMFAEVTIYYFAKKIDKACVADRLPKGFTIVENNGSGMPLLKRVHKKFFGLF